MLDDTVDGFKKGRIDVFSGAYTGTDPFEPDDRIDLRVSYKENNKASAPSFHYVLDDVITVEE